MNAPRSVGRPRVTSLDSVILSAALTELAERGPGEFSVLGVSERAGVGRGSIHRRWSTRNALIIAVLRQLNPRMEPPNTGTLNGDLLKICESLIVAGAPERLVVFYRLGAEAYRHPDLYAEFQDEVIAPTVATIVNAIRQAAQRGEVDQVPTKVAAQCLLGAVMTMGMQNQPPRAPSLAVRRQLVALLVAGLTNYSQTSGPQTDQ